jgi:hypothetical protein
MLFPDRNLIFGKELEALIPTDSHALPIPIDTLYRIQYSSI